MIYVSLGSSFASGPGITPVANRRALRSSRNYPSIIAQTLGAEKHIDVSTAGATLQDIVSKPTLLSTPQIESIDANVDLITITAGGNDLGYISAMTKDSARKNLAGKLLLPKTQSNGLTEEDLIARFHNVFDAIRSRAPKARIIVVGYPVLLGGDATSDNTGFSPAEFSNHKSMGQKLEEITEKACKGQNNVTFLSIWNESNEHGVGSQDPWVWGNESVIKGFLWSGPVPWHPNPRGMEKIARIVCSRITSKGEQKSRI
jgi:lysophospholipase L1-like esterase